MEKLEIEEKRINFDKVILKNIKKVSNKPFAFLRSSFMRGPINNLPPLTNKKLDIALK